MGGSVTLFRLGGQAKRASVTVPSTSPKINDYYMLVIKISAVQAPPGSLTAIYFEISKFCHYYCLLRSMITISANFQ